MSCDLTVEDLSLPDMEEVYRIAAARVTDAVRRGRVELALRWARILNLALRDRRMRARLPVTADEVRRRLNDAPAGPETPVEPAPRPADTSHPLHCSHPVFTPARLPGASPLFTYRRWPFREGERRR
jgi:hypothetical protein